MSSPASFTAEAYVAWLNEHPEPEAKYAEEWQQKHDDFVQKVTGPIAKYILMHHLKRVMRKYIKETPPPRVCDDASFRQWVLAMPGLPAMKNQDSLVNATAQLLDDGDFISTSSLVECAETNLLNTIKRVVETDVAIIELKREKRGLLVLQAMQEQELNELREEHMAALEKEVTDTKRKLEQAKEEANNKKARS